MNFRLSLLVAFALLLCPLSQAHANTDSGWRELLASLAPSGETALPFTETRESELLKKPLQFKGVLSYNPVSKLMTKTISEPKAMRMEVTGDTLRVIRGKKRRSIRVTKQSSIYLMLTGIRALASGDADLLEQYFAITLSNSDANWELNLTPLATTKPRKGTQLLSLTVRGKDSQLLGFDSQLSNGERHLISYRETDAGS